MGLAARPSPALQVAIADVDAVAEDASITGSVAATDADAGETATLTYALVGDAPEGLTFNDDGSYSFDASSYDSLTDGEELVLTIPFTATDVNSATSEAANLVITITGTNDIPVITGDLAATVAEGVSYAITTADLNFSDPDDNAAGVTFTITDQTNGKVQVGGVDATSFTGTQLAANQVAFLHDGSETLAASFKVSVEDGNEDITTPTPSTFNFTVNPINDAPTDIDLIANANIDQKVPGANIGTLVTTDADSSYFTYSIVSGNTGNHFEISGDQLNLASSDKLETLSTSSINNYDLDIRVTDSNGAAYNETIRITTGTNQNDGINGVSGDDVIYGFNKVDTIYGLGGDDSLFGLVGDDKLYGGDGNDLLAGGADNDILVGGIGNDILVGGTGNDTLTGGTGADTFVFGETGASNVDHIVDYSAAEGDKIDLQALLDANFNSGSNINDFVKLTQNGSSITVQVDTNGPVAGGAGWVDVCVLDGYGTAGSDPLSILIDGTDHNLIV